MRYFRGAVEIYSGVLEIEYLLEARRLMRNANLIGCPEETACVDAASDAKTPFPRAFKIYSGFKKPRYFRTPVVKP